MQRLTGGRLEKVDGWRSPPCEENCLPCEEKSLPFEENCLPYEYKSLPFEEKSLPCEENCLQCEENCGPAVNPLVIVGDVTNLLNVEFTP